MKQCTKCKQYKNENEFVWIKSKSKNKKDKYPSPCCKTCHTERTKKWKSKNEDKWKDSQQKQYHKHKDKHVKRVLSLYRRSQALFFDMYGRECACCGESNIAFLTLDHVKGQAGIKNKERTLQAYINATKEFNPNRYQVLCYNCNCAKGKLGYCPHQTQK